MTPGCTSWETGTADTATATVKRSRYVWSKEKNGIKYVNFWVIPRRLVYIGRRFGTLCQVHLQKLDV
jgi:hypothetical protein